MEQDRKVALITGSAKGLGKKTALSLAEIGFRVIVNYVNSEKEALELCAAIRSSGGEAMAIRADVTDRSQLESMYREAERCYGGVDVLVNNAGPFIRERRRFADYSPEEIDYLIHGNLLGVMHLDYLVLPHMRHSRWGRIIHFGFGHAAEARGWPHRAVYSAAKVGLVSFTKTLAEEEAEFGITVNMICPGDIKGANKEKSISEVDGLTDPETPRGRPGTGEDISRAIAFICDPRSDFITGNIMEVSGGFDPIRPLSLANEKPRRA
jgi:3-oxoacyl-[acyl-carrier protein] reductase